MRFRFLLFIAAIGILVAASSSAKIEPTRDMAAEVYLGGVIWSPSTIPPGNTSKLRVSVATTPSVPTAGIKAILSISLSQNFGGVSHSITPAEVGEVVLQGGCSPLSESSR